MNAFCKEGFKILESPTIAEFSYNFKANQLCLNAGASWLRDFLTFEHPRSKKSNVSRAKDKLSWKNWTLRNASWIFFFKKIKVYDTVSPNNNLAPLGNMQSPFAAPIIICIK